MARLSPPPAEPGSPGQPGRWVVCNQLDEDRESATVEWIRYCERCGTGVWVTPYFVEQGYRITCFWCLPPATQPGIHPQSLTGLDAGATEQAYLALGEIRDWLTQRTNPRRHRQ